MMGDYLGGYITGITPEIDDPFLHNDRYHEVLLHRKQFGLDLDPWIAIDDEQARYPEGLDNIILTNRSYGFSQKNAVELDKLLSKLTL